ncbi:3-hydroxybutyryl-CoA dehydratase [Thermanaeromonas toyohensis ToBE]|uniref:3-hydroxybutyryl-CoA dehydratase n=1 Tax=Thermanaeromonas toyohensis ToBE TaxID=698762 RepID=A0A1W1W165_9FIRM|nr:MaoC family dehydratase [Thermanaeromonas toyohensis]SMB99220.1 3-hydroxybutyryl-CoA dehydratase [Thermanaeromonas toyohensis ToBE]
MAYRFDEIQIGQKASLSKTITEADIYAFAGITGDFNPVHVDAEFAKKTIFKERIAHGLLTAGLISAVLGTKLPGPNSVYLKQELEFTAPVRIGDTITAEVEVMEKKPEKKILRLRTIAFNQKGDTVLKGEAVIKKLDS